MTKYGMGDTTRQWLLRTVAKNYWRVCTYYEFEDLVQDGYMVFLLVKQKYEGRGFTDSHISNLFKRSFINHIHDLSNKRTRQAFEVPEIVTNEDDDEVTRTVPGDPELQTIGLMIAKAPREIRAVLDILVSDAGRKRLRAPFRHSPTGSRETMNDRLCRLAGVDPSTNLVDQFTSYFSA